MDGPYSTSLPLQNSLAKIKCFVIQNFNILYTADAYPYYICRLRAYSAGTALFQIKEMANEEIPKPGKYCIKAGAHFHNFGKIYLPARATHGPNNLLRDLLSI